MVYPSHLIIEYFIVSSPQSQRGPSRKGEVTFRHLLSLQEGESMTFQKIPKIEIHFETDREYLQGPRVLSVQSIY